MSFNTTSNMGVNNLRSEKIRANIYTKFFYVYIAYTKFKVKKSLKNIILLHWHGKDAYNMILSSYMLDLLWL